MTESQGHEPYHIPVMLKESIDWLDIKDGGIYVDATFGGGGHSMAILNKIGISGRLFAFDQDGDAEINACSMRNSDGIPLGDDGRFTFVRSNFRHLKRWMRYYGIGKIDGLLADLGVSGHHFDTAERGFSLRYDSPLDMRMNRESATTAADIVADYSEEQLSDIMRMYGELRNHRQVASAIVERRRDNPIKTTGQLLEATERLFPRERLKKEQTKMFQALRMEVNHETDALAELLKGAAECMVAGGRLSIITYHSIEDRIVKNILKTGNETGRADKDFYGRTKAPFRASAKPLTPSAEELISNPRSRSAKLRTAIKI